MGRRVRAQARALVFDVVEVGYGAETVFDSSRDPVGMGLDRFIGGRGICTVGRRLSTPLSRLLVRRTR